MGYRNASGVMLPDTNQYGVRYVKGTWASETLWGSDGPDEFEGGGGRDTLVGGGGDDFYWVRDTRDVVRENAGGGVDTVKIWSSYTLPAHVENLIVFGGGSYAAGNDQNNIIQGLDGDQFIYGGRGEDVLLGGGGSDTFIVYRGEGNKVIQDFQSWSDKVRLVGGDLYTFDQVKAAMTQVGSDVVLNDGGTQIIFRNATIGQFTARDFQLPLNYGALGSQTFVDNFDSLQLGSVWKTNFGYAGDGLNSFTLPRNGELQVYVSPDFKGTTGAALGLNPYSVSNGVLTITAQPAGWQSQNMWGYQYTSGMLDSHHTQTYGYFEMRAELPDGQGLWPAFWLLGENNNEIDILEGLGSDTSVPHTAIHSNSVPALGLQNYIPNSAGFHTYGALWSPSEIIFYVDGSEIWRTATPSDMTKPMHMIVNLAVGGHWPGSPDATTPWPAQLKVDYVKAWNLPGVGAAPTPSPTPPPAPPPPPTSGSGVALTSQAFGDVLKGGAGADTLTAGNGGEQMTGGAGADVFVFGRVPWSPTVIKDFQIGTDKLDIAALLKGAPAAERVVLMDDGAGGTKVVIDPDGPGGAWPDYVAQLQGVRVTSVADLGAGGSTAPAPTTPPPPAGGSPGVTLTSAFPGDTLRGGSGADTLNASRGSDTLTGGDGADRFVFAQTPWSPATITDFKDGDVLDLRGMFKAGGAWSADPVAEGYLKLLSDGAGGAKVIYDSDGHGHADPWGTYFLHLPGVPPSSLDGADWVIR
ncbi:family 16 glycosylhydrolase [Phenylobacterium sp. J426]|uniref:family 16 glycosylhydrolase n=1 Tax=Phenylobacterium sp. J426 TaxID=2898439 RepID=UPI002151A728|nr:family 16 glycosylhydrolase [Phenylobacterium sp. J426]MCR5875923.1 family 16 glycosylhydrolase [Phenylobacterium sp. J426]